MIMKHLVLDIMRFKNEFEFEIELEAEEENKLYNLN